MALFTISKESPLSLDRALKTPGDTTAALAADRMVALINRQEPVAIAPSVAIVSPRKAKFILTPPETVVANITAAEATVSTLEGEFEVAKALARVPTGTLIAVGVLGLAAVSYFVFSLTSD
jgi:hypothetical protein